MKKSWEERRLEETGCYSVLDDLLVYLDGEIANSKPESHFNVVLKTVQKKVERELRRQGKMRQFFESIISNQQKKRGEDDPRVGFEDGLWKIYRDLQHCLPKQKDLETFKASENWE